MKDRIQQEIKDLQDKLVALQAQLALTTNTPQTEPTISFKGLSYRSLMAYYLEHSDSWFGYDRAEHKDICIAPEVYTAWREAYQVFKDRRQARDEQIRLMVINTTSSFDNQIIDANAILRTVANPIRALYETITPFDCDDEQWLYSIDSGSWKTRIKKKVFACLRELNKSYCNVELSKQWVADLRK